MLAIVKFYSQCGFERRDIDKTTQGQVDRNLLECWERNHVSLEKAVAAFNALVDGKLEVKTEQLYGSINAANFMRVIGAYSEYLRHRPELQPVRQPAQLPEHQETEAEILARRKRHIAWLIGEDVPDDVSEKRLSIWQDFKDSYYNWLLPYMQKDTEFWKDVEKYRERGRVKLNNVAIAVLRNISDLTERRKSIKTNPCNSQVVIEYLRYMRRQRKK
jgi:hypothetical protein